MSDYGSTIKSHLFLLGPFNKPIPFYMNFVFRTKRHLNRYQLNKYGFFQPKKSIYRIGWRRKRHPVCLRILFFVLQNQYICMLSHRLKKIRNWSDLVNWIGGGWWLEITDYWYFILYRSVANLSTIYIYIFRIWLKSMQSHWKRKKNQNQIRFLSQIPEPDSTHKPTIMQIKQTAGMCVINSTKNKNIKFTPLNFIPNSRKKMTMWNK